MSVHQHVNDNYIPVLLVPNHNNTRTDWCLEMNVFKLFDTCTKISNTIDDLKYLLGSLFLARKVWRGLSSLCGDTVLCSSSDFVFTVSLSLEAISEMTIFKGKRFFECTDGVLSLPTAVNSNEGAVSAFSIWSWNYDQLC